MKSDPLLPEIPFTQIEDLLRTLKKGGSLSAEAVLLKALLEDMTEGVIVVGAKGEFLFRNTAAQKTFGRSDNPVLDIEKWPQAFGTYRMDGSTLFHYQDLPLVRALQGEKTNGIEMFLRNENIPEGVFLSIRGRPLMDDRGQIQGGVIFCEDITRLKREQVRAQRMTDLVAFSPIGIIETTPEAKIISWNGSAEKIYGYRPEEVVGKHYSFLVPVHKVALMQRQAQRLLKGEPVESHETLRVRKDGRIIVTWCSASPLFDPAGQIRGFALVTQDITERTLPPVAEQIPDAILVISMEGIVTGWNPAAEKVFGYSKEEGMGKGFFALFPQEAKDPIRNLFESAKTGKTHCDFTTLGKKKSGDSLNISLSISPCKNQDGEIIGLSLVVRDITDLKMAESRISQWKSMVDASSEGVARDGLDGKILYWNKGCERIYGYSEAEVLGKPFSMLIPEGTPDQFPKIVGFIKEGYAAQYEGVRRRKDGQLIHVSVTLSPLFDPFGIINGTSVFIRDITDQIRMKEALRCQEEQLFRSQKMEVVGRLAAGVAHDFNNLLTAIHGNAQLLENENLGQEGREVLENMRGVVDRAVDLTRQLLMFSRKQTTLSKRIDLNQIVLEETRLLQRIMAKAFQLDCEPSETALPIEADVTELRQVLMNLAINARDAMPEGGKIIFQTRVWDSKGVGPDGSPLAPGRFAWLLVKDTGTGMTPETKEHIFEPFFTTKEEAKGTGLGLAIVYTIVTRRGGKISVESELGKGTVFHLCFPLESAG